MSFGGFILVHIAQLVLLAILLAGMMFFSASETALFSLSCAQLLRLREEKHATGRAISQIMRDPRQLLMVILLAMELISAAFFIVWTMLVLMLRQQVHFGTIASAVLILLQLFLMLLVGEVLPKNLAISVPVVIARLVALPMAAIVRLLSPIARIFTAAITEPLTRLFVTEKQRSTLLTSEELASLLDHSAHRGHIAPNESAWLREIIDSAA